VRPDKIIIFAADLRDSRPSTLIVYAASQALRAPQIAPHASHHSDERVDRSRLY